MPIFLLINLRTQKHIQPESYRKPEKGAKYLKKGRISNNKRPSTTIQISQQNSLAVPNLAVPYVHHSTFITSELGHTAAIRHVPQPAAAGTTQSPVRRSDTAFPTSITSPTPSLPPIAGSCGRRRYTPWIMLMSAGLMGAASIRISTSLSLNCNRVNVHFSLCPL